MRIVALVDGEHYPPVTRWGLETARERGHDVVGALLVGGNEKLAPGAVPDLGVPTMVAGADRMAAIIVIALRLVLPLGILRWPLAGGLLAMIVDAVDVVPLEVGVDNASELG